MFVLLITILSGLILYLFWWYRQKLLYWKNLGIPHETPHWMMGNVNGVTKTRSFTEAFVDYYRKFKGTGPFAGFYLSSKATVFVLEPQLVKAILIKDFNNFTDRNFYHNEADDPLSGNIFLLDGQKWRTMRNCLTPTFTSGKMKLMFPMIQEIGEEFLSVMQLEIEKKDSIVELKDLAGRFTIDVIGTCAFGLNCNSLKDPDVEFRRVAHKALNEFRNGDLVNALIISFPDLARKLHIKETLDEVENFYISLVRDTIKYRKDNNIQRNDFLGMLLDIKNQSANNKSQENLPDLTLEQIAAQAFVFFTAGFETSSSTMSFALYEMALNEDIQEKARQEIHEVLENHNGNFTYECMQDLQYMQQIINETLRLYTNAPFVSRIALNDYVVPDHPKYVIKKGMHIVIPAAAIHMDEEYYPEPEKFNPDNFTPELMAQRDSCLFLAFGEGPRNCIGMRFAKMQIIVGLTMLLKHFKFSICEKTEVPLIMDKTSFFLAAKGGIYLKVTKIKNK